MDNGLLEWIDHKAGWCFERNYRTGVFRRQSEEFLSTVTERAIVFRRFYDIIGQELRIEIDKLYSSQMRIHYQFTWQLCA